MSDARIQFLIDEAVEPLRERIDMLTSEIRELHTELHNAAARENTPARPVVRRPEK